MENNELEYVGFWPRVGASIIDTILFGLIILPILTMYYGESYWANDAFLVGPFDFLMNYIIPAIAVIVFWTYKQATPGKMAISSKVVDAKTGGKATTWQLVIRYIGYFIASIPLFIGIIWVAFDSRKQGWHDKIAGTVVVRPKHRAPQEVSFDN